MVLVGGAVIILTRASFGMQLVIYSIQYSTSQDDPREYYKETTASFSALCSWLLFYYWNDMQIHLPVTILYLTRK